MSQNCIARREPEYIAAGDSIIFNRYLRNYLPSNGWSLVYCLGGAKWPNITFTSTPDATSAEHQINVPAATTAGWVAGDAVLIGFAVNDTLNPSQRDQIYYGEFKIGVNFPNQIGAVPVWTFAQKMLESIETQLLNLSNLALEETRSLDWQVRYTKISDLRAEHGYWTQVRRAEIAKERARVGLPPGNRMVPRMEVTFPGPIVGEQIIPGAYR